MGGEIGDVLSRIAPAAKEWTEKIFSNEVSRVGLISGEKSVRAMGPWGDVLVDSVKSWQDKSSQSAGQYYSDMLKLMKGKVTGDTAKDFASHWQGTASPPNPELAQAVSHARMNRLGIYKGLSDAGVKVGPMVQDDWPRMYNKELFEGVNRQEALKKLQAGGMSLRQSESLLDQVAGKASKAHNYESARRVDLPGYRRDFGVLLEDADKGFKRLHYANIFGPNEEKLDLIFKGIRESGGVASQEHAVRYMDAILKRGKYYRGARPWEQSLASLQVASKLSLAVLSHIGQPLNVALFSGKMGPVLGAFKDMATDFIKNGSFASGEDMALRAGSLWSQTYRDVNSLYGNEVGQMGGRILKATGFNWLDHTRRVYASLAGRRMAEEYLADLKLGTSSNLARQKLGQLGLDADRLLEHGLTEDDYLTAAKRTSDITQFTFDANQLPVGWKSNPYARLLLQFKQYFYTQASFVKDYAIKPAFEHITSGGERGSLKPLMYLSLLFPAFGEAVADVKEFARKGSLEERPQGLPDRLIDNMSQAGGFGIFHDLVYNIASPSDKPIWHFVAGPTISDAVDLSRYPQQIYSGYQGGKKTESEIWSPLGLEGLRRVPFVGPQAADRLKKSQQKRTPKKTGLRGGAVTNSLDQFYR